VSLLCSSALLLADKIDILAISYFTFYIYIAILLVASLVLPKARLAQGLIIVVFVLIIKFVMLLSEDNLKLSIVFQIVLLLVALDRQGKEAGL